jgi:hypothetical protein
MAFLGKLKGRDMKFEDVDPKGLIRESYLIEGITSPMCKTIFFDWAIQVAVGADPAEHIAFCISHYGADLPDHPMTAVLQAALVPAPQKIRRGGRAGRVTEAGQRRDGQSV